MWTSRPPATPALSPAGALVASAARASPPLNPIFSSTVSPIGRSSFTHRLHNESKLRFSHFARLTLAYCDVVPDYFLRNLLGWLKFTARAVSALLVPRSAHRRNPELPHRLAPFLRGSNCATANRRSP